MTLSERFNKDPFYFRKQRFRDILLIIRRLNIYDVKNNPNKKRRIRKKAGDNWF